MATGQPCSAPKASISAAVVTGPSLPGTTGTPAAMAAAREETLSPMTSMASGGGPDERGAAGGQGPGEGRVLREESVSRMDGVGPAGRHRVEDGLGVEVALRRRLPAQPEGLVGQADMERPAVDLGVDGDAGDAQLPAGPDHPDGDLAPVGDQDLGEHVSAIMAHQRWTDHEPLLRRALVRRGRLHQPGGGRPGPAGGGRRARRRRRPPDCGPGAAGPDLGVAARCVTAGVGGPAPRAGAGDPRRRSRRGRGVRGRRRRPRAPQVAERRAGCRWRGQDGRDPLGAGR